MIKKTLQVAMIMAVMYLFYRLYRIEQRVNLLNKTEFKCNEDIKCQKKQQ